MSDLVRHAIFFTLIALATAHCVYWIALIAQVWRTAAAVPTARAGLALAKQAPPTGLVTVIVPAHNESAVIADLVTSLRAQTHEHLHVVLALDRCTDDTADVARTAIAGDPRFEIIELSQSPGEWAGKVNAVWQGVQRSRYVPLSEYLLFADADCTLDPSCIAATVALLEDRKLGMLSLASTLTHDTWFERLVQPAASFYLMSQHPLLRANRQDARKRAFANGQFMLFTRDAYRSLGGHAAVSTELLEDLALARLMKDREMPQGVLVSDGMVTCRMYATWAEFCRGWRRIFIEGAKRRPDRLRRQALRCQLAYAVLPASTVALAGAASFLVTGAGATLGTSLGVAGVAIWLFGAGWIYRMGRSPLWLVPGFVVGAWLVGGILRRAGRDLARGKAVEWAGRSYVREVRD